MHRYITVVLLVLSLAFTVFAAGVQFSSLTFYTLDLQSGLSDIFPIAYLTVPITQQFGLRFEDYVGNTHDTFKIGDLTFIQPSYWYATYRSGNINAYLGDFRSKHNLTRQMYSLRVGGFYDSTFGGEIDYRGFPYDFGAKYDVKYGTFGAYAGYTGGKYKIYAYAQQDNYTPTELHISADTNLDLDIGRIAFFGWGAAAYDLDMTNPSLGMPTVLVGGKASYRSFVLEAQFANQPTSNSAHIWYDFNDPNKAGYPLQDFNTVLTYNLDRQNSVGAFVNWNSNITTPVYGFQMSHGDLTLSVGSGDINGGISGTNYVTLGYSTYLSIPLTVAPLFGSAQPRY